MKTFYLIILLVSCIVNLSNAQSDTNHKSKIYKSWISSKAESYNLKCNLCKIQDSSILISNSWVISASSKINPALSKIDFNNIDVIKVRRNHKVINGLIIGTLAGFGIGALIGYASGDDPPDQIIISQTAGEKALTYGIALAIPGCILGAMFGSIKIKIPINGNYTNFKNQRNLLEKYTIQ
jgi:hypothetical protein